MRNISLSYFLAVLIITLCTFTSNAQSTPGSNAPDKMEVGGTPQVEYLEAREMTVGSVTVYLVGAWEDIRQSKDVLQLVVRFRAKGRKLTQPAQVDFGLTSYAQKAKYATDHKVTLIADGQTVFSADTRGSEGNNTSISEHYQVSVPYAEFARFANAKKAAVKFGGTTVELTEDMSKSLRDLNAKIER